MKKFLATFTFLAMAGASTWGCAYGGASLTPDGKNVVILKSGPFGAIRKVVVCEYEDEDLERCQQSTAKP